MMDQMDWMETEEERQARRRERMEAMKREKRNAILLQKYGIPAAVLALGIFFCFSFLGKPREDGGVEGQAAENGEARVITLQELAEGEEPGTAESEIPSTQEVQEAEPDLTENTTLPSEEAVETVAGKIMLAAKAPLFEAHENADTVGFEEAVISKYGVLIDVENASVLAQRAGFERMNPASMTKVLTLLVAAEHLSAEDLDATVPITIDITDYCYVNECSITGYELNEETTVRDLFYGTILPSGADASLALAKYVAGSHEAFVELMNEKVVELGLAGSTHFTNCVGLYAEDHYTTAYDMAVILKAAADSPFCREVLSARSYTTTATQEHPEGLLISNWFLRRIEDKDTHGEVLCGKTGFVDEAGNCAASLARGRDGKEYICVTAGSSGIWKCIADQVALYQSFLPE